MRELKMIGFVRSTKFAAAVVLAVAAFMTMATPSQAQTGHVYMKVFKVGFIIGGGGGQGVLTYHGHRYPFHVSGGGIGTIGIAGSTLSGTAYNLHSPYDLIGTYGAAGAGLSVIGGARVAQLQNEKGVLLQLQGTQAGFEATLGFGGMTITMP
jgi:hypothetical protein